VNFQTALLIKITAIETLVCHAWMRNGVFVKVVTCQPGLIGWGKPLPLDCSVRQRWKPRRRQMRTGGRGIKTKILSRSEVNS
jgi:hypothetical protein